MFLKYETPIETTEFTKENRDAYLHDPLFLTHFEIQNDLDFENFGVSIGGICVSKSDGIESYEREKVDIAYSADCIDTLCYDLISVARDLGRSEDVYPVLIIAGEDDEAKSHSHLLHVLDFLQSSRDLTSLTPDTDDDLDEDAEDEQE